MKKHLILLLASLLLAWQPTAAQEEISIIYGPGAQSCGSMLSMLDKLRRKDREQMEILFKVWMQGYVSGLNQITHLKFGAAADLDDPEAHFRWLLNYCEENPLDMVVDASEKLLEALVLRAAE